MYFLGLNSDANDLDKDWQLKTKVNCAKLEKSLQKSITKATDKPKYLVILLV